MDIINSTMSNSELENPSIESNCTGSNQCFGEEFNPMLECISGCNGSVVAVECYNKCVQDYRQPDKMCINGTCAEGCGVPDEGGNTACQEMYGPTGVCVQSGDTTKCSAMGPIDGSCEVHGQAFELKENGICGTKSCSRNSNCPDGMICQNGLCVYGSPSIIPLILFLIAFLVIGLITVWYIIVVYKKKKEAEKILKDS